MDRRAEQAGARGNDFRIDPISVRGLDGITVAPGHHQNGVESLEERESYKPLMYGGRADLHQVAADKEMSSVMTARNLNDLLAQDPNPDPILERQRKRDIRKLQAQVKRNIASGGR